LLSAHVTRRVLPLMQPRGVSRSRTVGISDKSRFVAIPLPEAFTMKA
jgi:hypothetical protein